MIEHLLTSKARIKILEYFFFSKEKSYLREISRVLKIPVSAVKREVDNLISINLLALHGKEITLNRNCNYLGELKGLFIKTDFLLLPLKKVLNNQQVQYAFLFGSFTEGGFNEKSDVDIVIISNKTLFELTKILKPVEKIIQREINPVVWTLEGLKKNKNSGFARDIFSKKIVMLVGEENELRKIVK